MTQKLNLKQTILFTGAFLAFTIGSGYASGQEIMQYFSYYGYKLLLTAAVHLTILIYVNYSFIKASNGQNFGKESQLYYYYGGKYLGKFFDCFMIAIWAMSYVMLIAGGAATLNQQFGIPTKIGAIIMAVLSCVSVILGLNAVVNVIGKIGPVLIIFILLIGAVTLITTGSHIPEGAALIESGEVTLVHGGTNWLTSALTYAGFALTWSPGFCSGLALKHRTEIREITFAAILAQIFVVTAGVGIAFSLVANIQYVADAQIPSLVLAQNIFPGIAIIFSILIFLAIYTSACPLLWSTVVRFTKEKSKPYTITIIVLGIIATIIALFFPFNIIVNFLFSVNGYVGMLLLICMIIKDFRTHQAGKKESESN